MCTTALSLNFPAIIEMFMPKKVREESRGIPETTVVVKQDIGIPKWHKIVKDLEI